MRRALILLLTGVVLMGSILGCSVAPAAKKQIDLKNPVVEYDSVEKLDQAIGFQMIRLTKEVYMPQAFSLIDKKIGQILYKEEGAEAEINVRMMQGSGDISGVNSVEYEEKEINGIPVWRGKYGNILVAWFELGDNTYAVSATGLSEQAFFEILRDMTREAAVNAADRTAWEWE